MKLTSVQIDVPQNIVEHFEQAATILRNIDPDREPILTATDLMSFALQKENVSTIVNAWTEFVESLYPEPEEALPGLPE